MLNLEQEMQEYIQGKNNSENVKDQEWKKKEENWIIKSEFWNREKE